jgi:SAM-dependent methyltransferase
MARLYDEDLAFIQASGFGELATAATASIIPTLKARGARRVVDIGCGAGVSTKALVDAGFDTLAVEPSAALLDIARRSAPSARFEQASAYDCTLDACDAILAIGEPLTYHAPSEDGEARLQDFIGKAGRVLVANGLLAFDLIEKGREPLTGRAWKAGPDWAVLSATHEESEASSLTRKIETFRDIGGGNYRRRSEIHHVRLFDRAVVVARLEQAGFEVEVATTYGGVPLPRRRVAFLASRR